jgi:hypothetical protein
MLSNKETEGCIAFSKTIQKILCTQELQDICHFKTRFEKCSLPLSIIVAEKSSSMSNCQNLMRVVQMKPICGTASEYGESQVII